MPLMFGKRGRLHLRRSALVLLALTTCSILLGITSPPSRLGAGQGGPAHTNTNANNNNNSAKSAGKAVPRKTLIGGLRNRVLGLFTKKDQENTGGEMELTQKKAVPRKRERKRKGTAPPSTGGTPMPTGGVGGGRGGTPPSSGTPSPMLKRMRSVTPYTSQASNALSSSRSPLPEGGPVQDTPRKRRRNSKNNNNNNNNSPSPRIARRFTESVSQSPRGKIQRTTVSVSTSAVSGATYQHVAFGTQSGGESIEESVYHYGSEKPPAYLHSVTPLVTRKVPVPRESRVIPYSDFLNSHAGPDTEGPDGDEYDIMDAAGNEAIDPFFTLTDEDLERQGIRGFQEGGI
mmetsp:Transcript_28011/g.52335  ORF Transcript_28011/g.52335 Transcript_28011/m.52335 type:complete len:345 (-) Transcript_28011:91-1125(-)